MFELNVLIFKKASVQSPSTKSVILFHQLTLLSHAFIYKIFAAIYLKRFYQIKNTLTNEDTEFIFHCCIFIDDDFY